MLNVTQLKKIEWKTIPAGIFTMGASQTQICGIKQFNPDYPDEWSAREHPQRQIYLSQFEIGTYPVTNRQFKLFVDDTGYKTDRELDRLGKSGWYKLPSQPLKKKWDHSMVCITYKDALAYCQWLGQETGEQIN